MKTISISHLNNKKMNSTQSVSGRFQSLSGHLQVQC